MFGREQNLGKQNKNDVGILSWKLKDDLKEIQKKSGEMEKSGEKNKQNTNTYEFPQIKLLDLEIQIKETVRKEAQSSLESANVNLNWAQCRIPLTSYV